MINKYQKEEKYAATNLKENTFDSSVANANKVFALIR